jgi:hypothetical protein
LAKRVVFGSAVVAVAIRPYAQIVALIAAATDRTGIDQAVGIHVPYRLLYPVCHSVSLEAFEDDLL